MLAKTFIALLACTLTIAAAMPLVEARTLQAPTPVRGHGGYLKAHGAAPAPLHVDGLGHAEKVKPTSYPRVAVHVVGAKMASGFNGPSGNTTPTLLYASYMVPSQHGSVHINGLLPPTAKWGYTVEVSIGSTGTHWNLGQQAHSYDTSGGGWQWAFPISVPILPTDFLSVCGPTATVPVQVYDATLDAFLFDGTIVDVPPCSQTGNVFA